MSFLTNDSGIGNFCNNIAGGISKGFLGSENTNRSLSDAAQKLYDLLDKTANRQVLSALRPWRYRYGLRPKAPKTSLRPTDLS